jgi:lariat debranching enzyme
MHIIIILVTYILSAINSLNLHQTNHNQEMKIAIQGCCHGDLDKIYATIEHIQNTQSTKIDLLICCGDFQAIRNEYDLYCINMPRKYLSYKDFYKYYNGERVAPVPTLFIGGNHEASNYLWELYYGGYVAPNIYYMGHSGVIVFNGLRIAGLSGIYKQYSYNKPYTEVPPYNDSSIRSTYHARSFEIFKLLQMQQLISDESDTIDVMLSHDWPANITKYGDKDRLIQEKPYFRQDIEKGELGSPASGSLLFALKPKYWFSGHLHCKFTAIVPHDETRNTKFLALDKCLPQHDFLQIVDIPVANPNTNGFEYDLNWLSIVRATNRYLITPYHFIRDENEKTVAFNIIQCRQDKLEKEELLTHKQWVLQNVSDRSIPISNFVAHAPMYSPDKSYPPVIGYDYTTTDNPQTKQLLSKLQIENYIARHTQIVQETGVKNEEEIEI